MLTDSHRTEHRFAQKSPTKGLVFSRLEFSNSENVRRDEVIAPWHEILVSLSGECLVARGRAGERLLSASTVIGVNPGERYAEEHMASAAAGVEAGGPREAGVLVILGLRDLEALGIADFMFREGTIEDEVFVQGLREIALAEARGESTEGLLLHDLVAAFVLRHGAPVPTDRLFVVKREIDRNPHAPLYVAQLAEMASMHPETFTRAFARRFGVTPIRYRLQRRLLEAAHLLITEPHMLVSEVAVRVGFEDLRFFHRSFRGRCGVSPAAYRQWFSEGALGRRRASGIPGKAAREGEQAA